MARTDPRGMRGASIDWFVRSRIREADAEFLERYLEGIAEVPAQRILVRLRAADAADRAYQRGKSTTEEIRRSPLQHDISTLEKARLGTPILDQHSRMPRRADPNRWMRSSLV
jgi:hypothetical protein